MAKTLAPIVLILGQDSFRADRALDEALKVRGADPSEVVRIWGDEASFSDVFAAATARSLFSERTVVVVRRAEKLRGDGKGPDDVDLEGDLSAEDEPAPKPKGRKGAAKAAPPIAELPELDPSSYLILIVRKADRRFGMWKRISKVAEIIDAEYLKGKLLSSAAAAEARALGLRLSDEVLRETIEQSGPSLGRIVSELEKMLLYQGPAGKGADDLVAVTSSPPLYLLSDALTGKDKRKALAYLDDALRQGEAGLRVLATLHSTVRRIALFRALRQRGVPSAEAGAQLGVLPFKIADTERAARGWSDADIGRALAVFAEADRRMKLSAPNGPVLTHALIRAASGARV